MPFWRTGEQAVTSPLSVLMDIGPAVHQRAGLSRYTTALASALDRHCGDEVDLRLFYNRHSGHQPPDGLRHLPSQTIPLNQVAWRLSVLLSRVMRANYRPLRHALLGRRVYHACEHLLPQLALPTVLTVHDLIVEHFPQHHTLSNRLFLRLAMPLFARGATHIIAVSHVTARDLEAIYGIERAKISVIHEGVEPTMRPPTEDAQGEVRARYSPDRPYLLMVGTLEPRKNHALALEALARLKAAGYCHRLVIVGGEGWLFAPVRALIATLGLEDDVVFAGYVPAGDLPGLYAGADCVLMPSLYEGFGLPVLEAMACGAPVVCSNVSSLPELAGEVARMISPHDADALAAAVTEIVTQPALAADLRARGIEHARGFTWERTARQTVEVYRLAAGTL